MRPSFYVRPNRGTSISQNTDGAEAKKYLQERRAYQRGLKLAKDALLRRGGGEQLGAAKNSLFH
jgi:hypothetical protein